jgi:alkylation response protein AidB-like acyl-CoA dehydrogenase
MDPRLSAEHRMAREAIREFCAAEVAPVAQEIEDESRFPRAVFDELAALDVLGVPVDEAWGGLGGDQSLFALICEELGRVSGAVGLSVAVHTDLVAKPIEAYGTEAQKERWLGPLATGEKLGACALAEPGPGRDASAVATTATREGDGWRLDGIKEFVTNADVAGTLLVTAVTDSDAGTDGVSTFIADRDDFSVEAVHETVGLNAAPTCEIRFDDRHLPADRLLGAAGDGWRQATAALDGGRVALAALAVGLAQGAYDAAASYAGEREQFGRPIAEFDAIRDTLVGMYRTTQRARLLAREAARRHDADERVRLAAALATLDASEAARAVAEDAVQVLGACGYTEDFAPQRFYRDAKQMEIAGGTAECQRVAVADQLGI